MGKEKKVTKEATNKYGLDRFIPAEVKKKIRVNSGFGCVICGLGIVDYEHVDPEFHDAKEHDPDRMTLLCPRCHAKVTRGMLSKATVIEAMKNPICKKQGFTNEVFDIGRGHPIVIFAGSEFINTQIPIQVNNVPIIEINPPEADKAPFLLSASFTDSKGNKTLKIIDNEWFAQISNWDVVVKGPVVRVMEGNRRVVLELKASPPDAIIISKIEMLIGKLQIIGTEKVLLLKSVGNQKFNNILTVQGAKIINGGVGFNLNY